MPECPQYVKACPFKSADTEALSGKLNHLPGWGQGSCPNAPSGVQKGMSAGQFNGIIEMLLSTKEGADAADDLHKYASAANAVMAKAKAMGCPHFKNQSGCPKYASGACPFKNGNAKAISDNLTNLPGWGHGTCPNAPAGVHKNMSMAEFNGIIEVLEAGGQGSDHLDQYAANGNAVMVKAKAQGCPHFKNQNGCPKYANGACPFKNAENEALSDKLKNLPGWGKGKCPNAPAGVHKRMSCGEFTAVIDMLLATKEGDAASADLKQYAANTHAVMAKSKAQGCPHFQ